MSDDDILAQLKAYEQRMLSYRMVMALNDLAAAYARHQSYKGYTHLFSDELQGAITNVLKAAGLED